MGHIYMYVLVWRGEEEMKIMQYIMGKLEKQSIFDIVYTIA